MHDAGDGAVGVRADGQHVAIAAHRDDRVLQGVAVARDDALERLAHARLRLADAVADLAELGARAVGDLARGVEGRDDGVAQFAQSRDGLGQLVKRREGLLPLGQEVLDHLAGAHGRGDGEEFLAIERHALVRPLDGRADVEDAAQGHAPGHPQEVLALGGQAQGGRHLVELGVDGRLVAAIAAHVVGGLLREQLHDLRPLEDVQRLLIHSPHYPAPPPRPSTSRHASNARAIPGFQASSSGCGHDGRSFTMGHREGGL
ncbi:hypothetical protein D3C72_958920 [compost metagenome]